jgi:hypothetical protein
MNLQDLKITVILAILFGIFLSSCEQYEYYPPLINDESEVFQYKKEQAFCKSNPDNEIWSISFTRDEKGNITEEITFTDGSPIFKTTRSFNSNNQQLTDATFNFINAKWQFQYSSKFIYNRNLLSEKLSFEAGGKNTHKTTYSYQGNELRWEESWYYFENEWKFQYAYAFEFNGNGKLIKRESYLTEKKDKVYDTFIYTYYNNKLVEEKRIIQTGATDYVLKFTYTYDGFPDETIQDGNIIEKNYYSDGRLTEKHTFYFGIDPGFSQCNGNLIYKYGY